MAKKKTVKSKEIQPEVEVKEEFKPETVDEGVVREQKKETPMDLVNSTVKTRSPGKWKKVSNEELADFEAKGLLVGYDPESGEVLIKEK